MENVYKIAVTEEIIGHSNGQKQVLVTVATSRTTGDAAQSVLDGNGAVKVTLSKVGRISSIVPLPVGMVAGANTSLTSTIVGEGNTVTVGEDNTVTVGEGNTVTITVLKADAENSDAENPDAKNLAVPAADKDLVPANSGVGVTFNFIAIGL